MKTQAIVERTAAVSMPPAVSEAVATGRFVGNRYRGYVNSRLAFLTAAIALPLAAAAVFGMVRFASIRAGFEYLAGERLLLTPSFHRCRVDAKVSSLFASDQDFPFRIYNCTNTPVKLLGESNSTCTCIGVSGVPVTIEPGGGRDVTVTVRAQKAGNAAAARIDLLTDLPATPTLTARILFTRGPR